MDKIVVRFILPCAMALTLMTGCHPAHSTASQPQAHRPLTLVALGASDVVGLGATHPASEGWAPELASLLPQPVKLVRIGKSGGLAEDLLGAPLKQAEAAKPDVAVVFTGVNDLGVGVPRARFAAQLDTVLGGLARTGARLYVLNLPDLALLPAMRQYAPLVRPKLMGWQDEIRQTATRHGAHVIELAHYSDELARHPEYLSKDGFHPSSQGYRRLASILAAVIAPSS